MQKDHLLLHGEDSSDDEMEDSKLDSKSIDKSFSNFIHSYKKSNSVLSILDRNLEHKIKDCFIAYYLGLRVLYRADIQERYIKFEKQTIKYEKLPIEINPKLDQLKKWVTGAVTATIRKVLILNELAIADQKTEEFLKFSKTHQALIEIIVNKLCTEPKQLLYFFRKPRFILQVITKELEQLYNLLKTSTISIAKASSRESTLTLGDLEVEYLPKAMRAELEFLADQASYDIATLLDQFDRSGDDLASEKSEDEKRYKYQNLAATFCTFWRGSDSYNRLVTLENPEDYDRIDMDVILSSHAENLLKDYAKDLLIEEKTNAPVDSILFQLAVDNTIPEKFRSALFEKLALNAERVTYLYQRHLGSKEILADSMSHQLAKTYPFQFKRNVLPRKFVFDCKNYIMLLSNLRLSHRSQKRQIRNLQSSKDNVEEISTLMWQISGVIINESQEITKYYARTDLAPPLGKYSEIAKHIEVFKKTVKRDKDKEITDAWIAELICKILRGENITDEAQKDDKREGLSLSWEKFLVSLTYLLFGIEVVRNPACLIVHQMALDLIKAKQLTWQQFFTTLMPMSIDEKAVQSGRYLASIFNNYVSPAYHESDLQSLDDHDIEKINQMITRTHLMFEKWLQYKGITRETDWVNQLIGTMNLWYPLTVLPMEIPRKPTTLEADKPALPKNAGYFFQDGKLVPFMEQEIKGDGNCTFNSPAQGIEQCLDEEVKKEIKEQLKAVLGDSAKDLKKINHTILRQAVVKQLAKKLKEEKDFSNTVVQSGLIPLLDERYEQVLELISSNPLLTARVTSAHDRYKRAGLEDAELAQLYIELMEIPDMWGGDVEIPIIEELCNIRLDIRQQVTITRKVKVSKLKELVENKAEHKVLKSSYEQLIRNELKTALASANKTGVKRLHLNRDLRHKILKALKEIRQSKAKKKIDPAKLISYLDSPAALQLYYDWFSYAPVSREGLEQDITHQCYISKYSAQGLNQERLQQINKHNIQIENTFFDYFSHGSSLSERTTRLNQVPKSRQLIVIYRGDHYNLATPLPNHEPILLTAPQPSQTASDSSLVKLSAVTQPKPQNTPEITETPKLPASLSRV